MVFEVTGKIALITGGASGLGFRYAKELLQNGLKGVTLADMDAVSGKKAEEELRSTFGADRALFIKTDVTKYVEFEEAFQSTIKKFKNVDILINNAGIMNDSIWEKEVAINMNGLINGMLLGLEKYLKNSKQGSEAVIVNISSVVGLNAHGYMPVYCGTKAAVVTMTQAWAWPTHSKRTGVRVVALCPGPSATPLMDMEGKLWSPEYLDTIAGGDSGGIPLQGLDVVAQELVRIIKFAENGTIWVVERDLPAYEFITPERETFRNNVLTEK
ncbi:15-hydroxyprostaglandin dehydrogenase [NAD(+)]-like [Leptinotarsa decemlineata]|uniref:15-hydroxyprostaglandin dehydrogenase [NAD(+)]-like n=1 Tax=Leptinotarsa decemlineata TaxID=7539 RepID=UPI003D30546C